MTPSDLIDRLETETRQLLEQVRGQFSGLPEPVLQHREEPGQWTILECFAHLNAIFEWYLPLLERAVHQAKARKWLSEQPVKYRGRGGRLLRRLQTARPRKFISSKKFNRSHRTLTPAEIKAFLIHSERLLRILSSARGTDLNRPRIRKAGAWLASYRLGNLLEWMVLHSQRHIAQVTTRIKEVTA